MARHAPLNDDRFCEQSNVAGKNLVRMTDLRACLEELGFEKVRTYIQSGNILFELPSHSPPSPARRSSHIRP